MGENSTKDQVRSWLPSEFVTTAAPGATTSVSEPGSARCSCATYGVWISCWTVFVVPLGWVMLTGSVLEVLFSTC